MHDDRALMDDLPVQGVDEKLECGFVARDADAQRRFGRKRGCGPLDEFEEVEKVTGLHAVGDRRGLGSGQRNRQKREEGEAEPHPAAAGSRKTDRNAVHSEHEEGVRFSAGR